MTTKKRKAKKPMVWTCLSCDSDYPRDVKFCPSCHIVSPYESGAFPSVKGQSELARLRAALSAMTTERNAILKATNEHTGSCFAERDQLRATIADLTTALEEIARGRGAYSHDPMEHGENCINHMKQTANDALARAKESK